MYYNCRELRKLSKKNDLPYYKWTKDGKFRYYYKADLVDQLIEIGKVDRIKSYFYSFDKLRLLKFAFDWGIKNIKLTDTKAKLVKKVIRQHDKLFILKF